MEGVKAKRSAGSLMEEDHQEAEDAKVERFFALVRGFHEARNRIRDDDLRRRSEVANAKKMKRQSGKETASWVPTFQWEDFTEEIEFRRPPVVFSTPPASSGNNEEMRKKQDEDIDELDHNGINLNLAL